MASWLRIKHPFGAAFTLAFCLMNTHTLGHQTSCEFPSVRKGEKATFSCHLPLDMQSGIYSLLAKRFKGNKEEDVADCHRNNINSKYNCTMLDPRFSRLTRTLSRELHLQIDKASDDLEGEYECHIPPVEHGDASPCSFQLEADTIDVTTEEPTTKPQLAKTKKDKESLSPAEIGLFTLIPIVVCLLVILLAIGVFWYMRQKKKKKKKKNPAKKREDDHSRDPMMGEKTGLNSMLQNDSTPTNSTSLTASQTRNTGSPPSMSASTPNILESSPTGNPSSPELHAASTPNIPDSGRTGNPNSSPPQAAPVQNISFTSTTINFNSPGSESQNSQSSKGAASASGDDYSELRDKIIGGLLSEEISNKAFKVNVKNISKK